MPANLLTCYAVEEFRKSCRWEMTFWATFEEITSEESDGICMARFEYMQTELLHWIEENTICKVYYDGDPSFLFESRKERDQFYTECCGDPVASKLRWSGPIND